MFEASAFHPVDPDAETLARIHTQVRSSLTPVRPLPQDGVLVPGLAVLLMAFAIAVSFAVGQDGFLTLTWWQRSFYYIAVALAITGGSRLAVSEAIPGSRRVLHPFALLLVCLAVLAGVVATLFPHFDLTAFLHYGWRCLTIGTVTGLVAALLLWMPMRRSFFSSPVRAGAVVGALCGLAGVAVLAIFCPLLNAAHILVWHLGAVLITTLGGAGVAALSRLR